MRFGCPDDLQRRRFRVGQVLVLAAVLVVAAILLSPSRGQDSRRAERTAQEGPAGAEQVSDLLAGIPQRGTRLGVADAPVVLTEYVDLQCPYCRLASQQVLPSIIREQVRAGRVRLELRTLTFIGEDSVRGARAAHAAATSNRMWQFAELWFANQGQEGTGYATDAFIGAISRGAGVDPQRALDGTRSRALDVELRQAERSAQRVGVEGTPTFVLGSRPDAGRVVPVDEVAAAVRRAALAS